MRRAPWGTAHLLAVRVPGSSALPPQPHQRFHLSHLRGGSRFNSQIPNSPGTRLSVCLFAILVPSLTCLLKYRAFKILIAVKSGELFMYLV